MVSLDALTMRIEIYYYNFYLSIPDHPSDAAQDGEPSPFCLYPCLLDRDIVVLTPIMVSLDVLTMRIEVCEREKSATEEVTALKVYVAERGIMWTI
ncbi:hypothetical protein MTR67_023460 [Solanum verrucosum]|uniref:Uncharacterized protein n=1 Tax=Solanum verrucosum TaxID=315347 RepID=A0AAF0QZS6_SOLVR|nr:hypothetical protein MTR67_023460 [Solanum verrucosum]